MILFLNPFCTGGGAKIPIFKYQILRFGDFQAQNLNFHLPLEQKTLKLEASSFGNWPITMIFKEQAFLPPPPPEY